MAFQEGVYNGRILDGNYGNPGGTGVKQLTLPFVGGGAQPYEIIRRPIAGESTAISSSRLANQAQIRVLLSDTQAGVHMPDYNGDNTQDVELVSQIPSNLTPEISNTGGRKAESWSAPIPTIFGEANTSCTGGKGCDANFVKPPKLNGVTLRPAVNRMASGRWLAAGGSPEPGQLGMAARDQGMAGPGLRPGIGRPTTPGSNTVTDHKNAILYFQMQADRNGDGTLTTAGDVSITTSGTNSQYNWFPINMYDAREGETRDWATAPSAATCSVNGIMNAVELDVGNLRKWLKGTTGTTGSQVDYVSQNGYILYFSDRRGMLADPLATPSTITGGYGFEDVINSSSNNGTPNGALEPNVQIAGVARSPEDLNGNGRLDKYGATNVGDGFGINTNTSPPDPFTTRVTNCYTTGARTV